jgi:hypothetical protein
MYVRSIAMERAPPRDRTAEAGLGAYATAEATIVAKRMARKEFMVAVDLDNDD